MYYSYSDDEDGCGGLTDELVVRSAGGSHYLTARTESARNVCLYWQTEAISGRPTDTPLSVCRQAVEVDIAVLDEDLRLAGVSARLFGRRVHVRGDRLLDPCVVAGGNRRAMRSAYGIGRCYTAGGQNTAEGQSSESVAWLMAEEIICLAEAFDVDP